VLEKLPREEHAVLYCPARNQEEGGVGGIDVLLPLADVSIESARVEKPVFDVPDVDFADNDSVCLKWRVVLLLGLEVGDTNSPASHSTNDVLPTPGRPRIEMT
jgi:hypothetical protein